MASCFWNLWKASEVKYETFPTEHLCPSLWFFYKVVWKYDIFEVLTTLSLPAGTARVQPMKLKIFDDKMKVTTQFWVIRAYALYLHHKKQAILKFVITVDEKHALQAWVKLGERLDFSRSTFFRICSKWVSCIKALASRNCNSQSIIMFLDVLVRDWKWHWIEFEILIFEPEWVLTKAKWQIA